MTELICIVCPKGCHLKVDEANDYAVSGNGCPRGAEYGKKELVNPTRVITTTVAIEGGTYRRVPVKTAGDIPKGMIKDIMDEINKGAPRPHGTPWYFAGRYLYVPCALILSCVALFMKVAF